MSWLWRFLGRFPRTVSVLIAACFAAGLWSATDYVENVVKPREAAARQARIEAEIARADALYARGKYDLAIAEYGYVLDSFGAEIAGPETARLHQRRGLAHVGLAEAGDAAANLPRALEAFSRALEIRAAAADTAGEMEIGTQIGDAWRALAHARGDAAPLDAAAAAYRAALDLAGDADPPRRAAGLRAVANTYRDRFEIAGDKAALATAFALYEDSMTAADPENWPVARGETLIEVGLAWVQEAENGYRTRNLLKAVDVLEGARTFLRQENAPHQRALLHKHIGDVYVLLSRTEPRRRADRASHQQSVVRWQNRAELAYKVARSFGYTPAKANIVPGNPRAAPAPAEDDDKE